MRARRFSEDALQSALADHAADCETCEAGEECKRARKIEAAFWDKIDHQIDDDRERRG